MGLEWTSRERSVLRRLNTPWRIQEFLDGVAYSTDPIYRSPRAVLRDRRAHCVDGALLAAAALRHHGHRPLVTWIDADNDDGHMLALFRRAHAWGGVAKSNMVGLRYREPVYRSLRELVMSYFDEYFNTLGERTMRGYRRPMDLARHDDLQWMTSEGGLEELLDVRMERLAKVRIVSPAEARALRRVDERRLEAGMLGANPSGLFVPKRRRA